MLLRPCKWTVRSLLAPLPMRSSRYLFSHLGWSLSLISFIQLLFNLWDTTSWAPTHAGFDFHACYCFVIDFFDAAQGRNAKARARKLLDWWNLFVCFIIFLYSILTYFYQRDISDWRNSCQSIQVDFLHSPGGSASGTREGWLGLMFLWCRFYFLLCIFFLVHPLQTILTVIFIVTKLKYKNKVF